MSLRTSTWVHLYGDAFANKKISAAAKILTHADVHKMIGHLAALWCWCMEFAQDGDLGHLSDLAVMQAAGWPRGPARFVAALIETGLLDADRKIHDWDAYAGLLIDRRKRDAARKRAERAAQKMAASPDRPPDTPRDIRMQPSPAQPREERLASPPLRSERDGSQAQRLREVLSRFEGYRPNDAFEQELLADDAFEVIVEKIESIAERPGYPGATWQARVRGYLGKCQDTLDDERARVREARRGSETAEETRAREAREIAELDCRAAHRGAHAVADCPEYGPRSARWPSDVPWSSEKRRVVTGWHAG